MKSYIAKPQEIERNWILVDAKGKKLGRLASEVAKLLRGKHKPTFTPHVDCGDHVIIINADRIELTGRKLYNKVYRHHSNHPGGLKEVTYKELMEKNPEKAVRVAVKGMLPKNSLGRKMIKKLKVYRGTEHNHEAQKPEVKEI
ncbi:MAG: 50S ribosomal protein L13 [Firmicutes bacterium]|nr:50S ribosomal protein L13 [Bacillota bacterium]MTI71161.1 50S ribosomal protein L13 [Bacillota bacterium]